MTTSLAPPVPEPTIGFVAYVPARRRPLLRWVGRAMLRAIDREAHEDDNGLRLLDDSPSLPGGKADRLRYHFSGRRPALAGADALTVRVDPLDHHRIECCVVTEHTAAAPIVRALLDDLRAAYPDAVIVGLAPPARTPAPLNEPPLLALPATTGVLATDVLDVILTLAPEDQTLLLHWHDREQTVERIADTIGRSPRTVNNRINALRQHYGEQVVPSRGPRSPLQA